MISVLVNWAYVFVITFILGRFTLTKAYKFYGDEYRAEHLKASSSVAAGLVVTTVYAGFFSLFYKVGIVANIVIILICATIIFLDFSYYSNVVQNLFGVGEGSVTGFLKRLGIIKIIVLSILLVAVVFFTTEGQFFSDSGYYHEQAIRWIEEFGTVKGSCHILKRLAYNSCYFVQCALFSMRDLWGQSLHCLGGFYAIFLIAYSVVGFDKHIRTNMLRITPLIYFILFCSEITSPASDFPLVFLILYVAIRWFELIDEERDSEECLKGDVNKESNYAPYALLVIFVVFIISIKLTVGCLVLIVLRPAIIMIREKKVKEIIASIVSGIVIILPYFIRNYLICGWLIYPFTSIDLFKPEWKMAIESVQSDADEIKVWGRGMGMLGGQASDSIRVWLPHWWEYMSGPNQKIIVALGLVAVAYGIFRVVRLVLGVLRDKKIRIYGNIFELAIVVSIIFWFIEAPLIRYGIAYILIALFYMLGDMLDKAWTRDLNGPKRMARIVAVVLMVALLSPMWISLREYLQWDYECIRYYSDYKYFVKQEDYPRVEYEQKELDGVIVYYPAEDMGQIGYHIFPAVWTKDTNDVKRLGDDIKDGFKHERE